MGVVIEGTTRAGVSGVGPSLRVNFSTPIVAPGRDGGTGDLGTWKLGDLPGGVGGVRRRACCFVLTTIAGGATSGNRETAVQAFLAG